MKSRGPGISPGYYEFEPWLLLMENRRKIKPKETSSCLIPCQLVVFSRQLGILGTTLSSLKCPNQIRRGSLHYFNYHFTYDLPKIRLHYVPQQHSKLGRIELTHQYPRFARLIQLLNKLANPTI